MRGTSFRVGIDMMFAEDREKSFGETLEVLQLRSWFPFMQGEMLGHLNRSQFTRTIPSPSSRCRPLKSVAAAATTAGPTVAAAPTQAAGPTLADTSARVYVHTGWPAAWLHGSVAGGAWQDIHMRTVRLSQPSAWCSPSWRDCPTPCLCSQGPSPSCLPCSSGSLVSHSGGFISRDGATAYPLTLSSHSVWSGDVITGPLAGGGRRGGGCPGGRSRPA